MNNWPPSNYPIFLALVLLAATAVTLAMGDEKHAEDLAIYAYYLLVIGVAIRFFELALPEDTVQKLGTTKTYLLSLMRKHASNAMIITQGITGSLRFPHIRLSRMVRFKKDLAVIADVSKNIAVLLSVFLMISLMYGLIIDWGYVKGYLSNLILIILGALMLHIFTKRCSS